MRTEKCLNDCRILPGPGKKHGITELHPDVVSYVSHATQQRLQSLVEKISETAQQKNFSYKVTRGFPALSSQSGVPGILLPTSRHRAGGCSELVLNFPQN